MDAPQYTDLTGDALDALLGRQQTAVLALAHGDEPYAIPVSYGYDDVNQVFYLQLVVDANSEKRLFLGASPQARLVVSEHREGIYRSAIAEGTLEKVFRDELSVEEVYQYSGAKRPLLEMWDEDEDIELYELDPEVLTGREFSPVVDSD